jgi:2'-5' RNA ligase
MRAFLALELPFALRQNLYRYGQRLAASKADVAWAPADNMHLTVKFLGEINAVQEHEITQIMHTLASATPCWELRIGRAGAFNHLHALRVIWAGIDSGVEEFMTLAEHIEQACARIGFPKEKRALHAHITLGRVRSARGHTELFRILQETAGTHDAYGARVSVQRLILYASTLTAHGAVYTPVNAASLSAA